MTSYTITTSSEPIDWSLVEKATIQECKWSPNPAPAAIMQAVYIPDKGIVFHLKSFSSPTRAENWEPDSPVWEDSCLEAFVSFDGASYINLEANSNGALRASFGSGRNDRTLLACCDVEMPQVSAVEGPDSWEIFLFLPSSTVLSLYGISIRPGIELSGNFYSCGDETPAPHFSSWNSIDTETPDFHRPEFFGSLIIE